MNTHLSLFRRKLYHHQFTPLLWMT
jgi:hypothetical protein